ncbi:MULTISPECIES: type IV secretory system conjugative DNA transfer family protein [Metabacillus]|uniref:type IV secretory system conjugative DNA transfer family protein n=1 Tax=Metabacillus TaxID=2675233 RepID=UPI00158E9A3E|nr:MULTISPECIES: TraM recognition domain-containing protein [Metabacillus]MCM3443589.1 TraM recognition domain-containing protein [Metabacillus halosaccharovorans]
MIKDVNWKAKLPVIVATFLFIHSLYQMIRALFNEILLFKAQSSGEIVSYIIFGDPLHPSLIGFAFLVITFIATWLLSTRIKLYKTMKWRVIQFLIMLCGIIFHYAWIITAVTYNKLVPYFSIRADMINLENKAFQDVLIHNTDQFFLLLMALPLLAMFMLFLYLGGLFTKNQEDLVEAFRNFEVKGKWIQRFSKFEKTDIWPDVELGPSSESGEMVTIPGRDRTLNSIIIGSIGTGKTAALGLPMINQDLHWMTKFINDYPSISQKENYNTEDVKGMYLNGISIIEPSNDLCQKALKLVKAHGIPERSITYINPLDPNTPSINPMKGPVDKVAETFTLVIEGLNESGETNEFFQQSQRTHLKHYIYLLKLHDPEKEVTFDMLLDMYNNSQLVRKMHEKLKKTFPADYDLIADRDERNHWQIVKQIDEWFDLNLVPKTMRTPQGEIPIKVVTGPYRGETEYYDAKAEFVQGLRNVLNDIGANKLIRRVLFGKSDFDFDQHLESGGILLCNSSKGELSGLANVLGKIVLLSLQNAVFRRPPNVSTFHHIMVDEAPDYLYQPFREFPAQSRKYKVIVTIILQTITQLADRYGEYYMDTLIGTLRNRMVYGDLPAFDSEYFSKVFGEKFVYEESTTEQSVSPLQDNPMTRSGSSYSKKKDVMMTTSDVIYQDAFQCSVKIVVNNKPMPVQQIKANFVPDEEFKNANVKVDAEAAEIWLEDRRLFLEGKPIEEMVSEGIEIDEDEILISENDDKLSSASKAREETIDEKQVEEVVSQRHVDLPKDDIIFSPPKPSRLRTAKSNANVAEEVAVSVEEAVAVEAEIEVVKETPMISESKKNPEENQTELKESFEEDLLLDKQSIVKDESQPEPIKENNKQEDLDDWQAQLKTPMSQISYREQPSVDEFEKNTKKVAAEKSQMDKKGDDLIGELYTFLNDEEDKV